MSDYAASVAAEVAARYGAIVRPEVVQLVPRGTSGFALPIWDPVKKLLITPDWEDRKRAAKSAIWRGARNRLGAKPDPEVAARRAAVAEAHARGLTDAQIAVELAADWPGITSGTVANDRRAQGLAAHMPPPPLTPSEVRRRTLRRLLAEGADRARMMEVLQVGARGLARIAAVAKLALPPAQPAPRAPRLRSPRQNCQRALARKERQAARAVKIAAQEAQLRGLVEAGADMATILAEMQITRAVAVARLRSAGLALADPLVPLRAQIRAAFDEGLAAQDIAARIGLSCGAVGYHMREMGLKRPAGWRSAASLGRRDAQKAGRADRDARIVAARERGLSVREIAAAENISLGAVHRVVSAAGVQVSRAASVRGGTTRGAALQAQAEARFARIVALDAEDKTARQIIADTGWAASMVFRALRRIRDDKGEVAADRIAARRAALLRDEIVPRAERMLAEGYSRGRIEELMGLPQRALRDLLPKGGPAPTQRGTAREAATLALRAEVVRLTQAGLSTRAVGAQIGLSAATVRYHLRAAADMTKIAAAPGRRAEILTLIGEGLTRRAVARKLGISDGLVRYHLSRADAAAPARKDAA